MAYSRILTASIVAAEGHGKTDFLKSMPTPAGIIHIDPNTEEQFEAAFDRDELDRDNYKLFQVDYPKTVFQDRDGIQDEAETIYTEQLIGPLKELIEDDDIKAIGFDTGTELFELQLFKTVGKLVQIMPEMRTKANYEFKQLLMALKRSKKHTVLLHRSRPVYEDKEVETNAGTQTSREKIPGVYEREGFSRVGYAVNVEAYLIHKPERSEKLSRQFGMRIAKSTARPALKTADPSTREFWDLDDKAWLWGREKINGQWVRRCSFPYLATLVYPDTSIKDWV